MTGSDRPVPGGRIGGRLPALDSPVYRRFLGTAFLGNVGVWMQVTAQGWLVLGLTDSAAALGVASAAGIAPVLVLSLLGGVLADRVDRRRILMSAQFAAAAFAAVLAVLTTTGRVEYWQVLVLAVLTGSATALSMPAFQAIVSTLVPRAVLGNAIALNAAQFNLSRIIGPVAAGVAIAAGGLAVAFWINAAMLVVVGVVVTRLPLADAAGAGRAPASLWSNLVDGLLALAAVPGLFMLNYLALLPVMARDVLGLGAGGLGVLTAAIGVGALTGSLTVAIVRPSGGSGRLLVLGLAVASVALIGYGFSTSVPLSLALLAVLGAAQVAYYATTNTLLQILVPGRLRGRVLSLYILTSFGAIPIGNLAAGALAERFGAPLALAGGGVLTLLILALIVAAYPPLRHLRVTRPADS